VNSILQNESRSSIHEIPESAEGNSLEISNSKKKSSLKHGQVNAQELTDLGTSHAATRAGLNRVISQVGFVNRIVTSIKEIKKAVNLFNTYQIRKNKLLLVTSLVDSPVNPTGRPANDIQVHIPATSAAVWVSQLEIGGMGLEVTKKMLVFILFIGGLSSLTRPAQPGVEPCGCPAHPNQAKPGVGRRERCSDDWQAWLL
jgi:hypothetical protein